MRPAATTYELGHARARHIRARPYQSHSRRDPLRTILASHCTWAQPHTYVLCRNLWYVWFVIYSSGSADIVPADGRNRTAISYRGYRTGRLVGIADRPISHRKLYRIFVPAEQPVLLTGTGTNVVPAERLVSLTSIADRPGDIVPQYR